MSRIICIKCYNPLTTNTLYRVSKRSRSIKAGQYALLNTKDYYAKKYFAKRAVIVNPANILDKEQIAFKRGHGCCGNSEEFFCLCGVEVGWQRLDCYEDNTVRFKFNKILIQHNIPNQ
jgi:hypothetical protein